MNLREGLVFFFLLIPSFERIVFLLRELNHRLNDFLFEINLLVFGIGIEFLKKGLRLLSPAVSHKVKSIFYIPQKELNCPNQKEQKELNEVFPE